MINANESRKQDLELRCSEEYEKDRAQSIKIFQEKRNMTQFSRAIELKKEESE